MVRAVRLLALLLCFTAAQALLWAADLNIMFFDVGQGDAALVTTPGGKRILVDAGSPPQALETGERVVSREVLPFLRQLGVERIDAIIISHAHPDHVNGLWDVLTAFPGTPVHMPAWSPEDAGSRAFADRARAQGTTVHVLRQGARIAIDPAVSIAVFGPPAGFLFDLANDNSSVVRFGYGAVGVLFTGDAGAEALDWCAERFGSRLRSTVLKMPHHGSYNATNGAFLAAVAPAAAVISCGENPYGHPHEKTLRFYNRRKVRLYRTDLNGTVTVRTDGRTYAVTPERP